MSSSIQTPESVLETPLSREELRARILIAKCARHQGMYTYTDLNRDARLGLDFTIPENRGKLGHLLGRISYVEVKGYGRPMLSSVVITKTGSYHGKGFFDLATKLYPNKDCSDETFGFEEMRKTHKFWKSDEGLAQIQKWQEEYNIMVAHTK